VTLDCGRSRLLDLQSRFDFVVSTDHAYPQFSTRLTSDTSLFVNHIDINLNVDPAIVHQNCSHASDPSRNSPHVIDGLLATRLIAGDNI
jgi:hypothetical protein